MDGLCADAPLAHDDVTERFLSRFGVSPPNLRRFTVHKSRHGDKHINHARIMVHAGDFTEPAVHLEGIAVDELTRLRDAKQAQVLSPRSADIRQIGELPDAATLDFGRAHATR